jgi:hypothetical protein
MAGEEILAAIAADLLGAEQDDSDRTARPSGLVSCWPSPMFV